MVPCEPITVNFKKHVYTATCVGSAMRVLASVHSEPYAAGHSNLVFPLHLKGGPSRSRTTVSLSCEDNFLEDSCITLWIVIEIESEVDLGCWDSGAAPRVAAVGIPTFIASPCNSQDYPLESVDRECSRAGVCGLSDLLVV